MKYLCHIIVTILLCFLFINCSPDVLISDDVLSEDISQEEGDGSGSDTDISADDEDYEAAGPSSSSDEDYDAAGNDDDGETSTETSPEVVTPVTVAFIGDQGLYEDAQDVLTLILNEGADMVLHQGDFDYEDDPDAWDDLITDILGDDFPYFASVGNHDVAMWTGYQDKLEERLTKFDGVACDGDLGAMSACTYKDIYFILSSVGTIGDDDDHADYIEEELSKDDSIWRICSWHKNQTLMQVGSKSNATGWGVYEACREGGAIIATAHHHGYSRTHLMSDFENQVISSTSSTLVLDEGETFAFVSGLGGAGIYGQDDDLADDDWWASVYTSEQSATHGALFCTFGVNNTENEASCYFKNIDGYIIDEFDLVSQVNL